MPYYDMEAYYRRMDAMTNELIALVEAVLSHTESLPHEEIRIANSETLGRRLGRKIGLVTEPVKIRVEHGLRYTQAAPGDRLLARSSVSGSPVFLIQVSHNPVRYDVLPAQYFVLDYITDNRLVDLAEANRQFSQVYIEIARHLPTSHEFYLKAAHMLVDLLKQDAKKRGNYTDPNKATKAQAEVTHKGAVRLTA